LAIVLAKSASLRGEPVVCSPATIIDPSTSGDGCERL
jgi:hypothetical protein